MVNLDSLFRLSVLLWITVEFWNPQALISRQLLTCDDQTLVVIQDLRDETRDNQLRIDQEADFFLHQSCASDAPSDKAVGKVNLTRYVER